MDPSHSSDRQWSWPPGLGTENATHRREASPSPDAHPASDFNAQNGQAPNPQPAQEKRHYKPRTCRICLEVVQPTTEIDDSIIAGLFVSRARVRYVSEDPELGRLMSPCLCKGSQKYVHEGCLQAWRQASPLSDRNFWRCPTCHFEYRLNRLRWGRWLSSKLLRAALTVLALVVTVFFLGFVADPIINLWVDPLGSIADTISDVMHDINPIEDEYDPGTWSFHFLKGFLSLGLLGFLKTFLAMSPWHWFNLRTGGVVGGRRRGATGRDRIESINWALVMIGVFTFLGATYKLVSHLSAQALEKASDRVVDVQGDDPDEDEDDEDGQVPEPTAEESRKDR
ncbi:hypothetical protein B0T25DRAFT_318782 [Lasiosphaeria hispida]|uniref:RING-CH-type domain-containing protein n=1 Tax=Lasiosphaeria hispida TaxID=260671 RepID=A0AAJ0H988_9PEZI|nr:hypothetical protein B0T25DRAFT_318782 [Lasiosphaeria hispida]